MESLESLWATRCAGCDVEGAGQLCPDCLGTMRLQWAPTRVPGTRGAVAAAAYRTPIGVALQRGKYGANRAIMITLARAFAQVTADWVAGGAFTAVVPAPSPWTRRVARGFSPASVLAGAIARRGVAPLRHALVLDPGRRNAGLGAAGRRVNLQGRLRARIPVPGRVLLVDDVVTTGTTAASCARELLGDATSAVWVLALCATAAGQP